MHLTIVLRREVADEAAAQVLTDYVADKVSQYPDVTVTASVGSQIVPAKPPE